MTNFLHNFFSGALYNTFSLGLAANPNPKSNGNLFTSVAAGDPTLGIPVTGQNPSVNEHLMEARKKGKEIFKVAGSSMSPENISNGDFLVCRNIAENSYNFRKGQYVIIAVDTAYYAHKGKKLLYDFKLRKTLFKVKAGMTPESLIDELKKTEDSLLLNENQKRLKRKYKETRSYEKYKDIDLILSVTYRKGEIRYSFHPVHLIEYVAETIIKVERCGIIEKVL